ncbi:hypothetical protein OPT61_g5279 [Boeremia exigua]|uniref:Uncharacterized protein n=1 Tax=Boeremia exigua TaxID=749465 RepID=A0ACC2IAT7_9PLEO|nr:hypothetical protein OPT61_g5279 [Boeremia exigua]
MLKNCSKPTDRRSIVAGQVLQRNEDLKAAGEGLAEPEQQTRHPKAMEQERVDALSDSQPVEPADHSPQVYSPNHFLKQRKYRPDLTSSSIYPGESTFYVQFQKHWYNQKIIGEGADGIVHLYRRREQQNACIAVKLPRYYLAREDLRQEIVNMHIIGQHEHILGLRCASEEWFPYGPAMFLPYCELGSLIDYRKSWCTQQRWNGQPECVSEITMWKLYRDMILALDYLHNQLGTRYVHNDFKPANILAAVPTDYVGGHVLPEEPVFKLSDFARLTPWPTPKGKHAQCFDGTPEYAPPLIEQAAPVHPSADIWGLGATLQYMALGIAPIQSREAFVQHRKETGKTYPNLEDNFEWTLEYWRSRIPTVFRPIHVSLKVLQKDYDLPYDLPGYRCYSSRLGCWYMKLWKPVNSRPKVSVLVAQAIPYMDDMVERLKLERSEQMIQGENTCNERQC